MNSLKTSLLSLFLEKTQGVIKNLETQPQNAHMGWSRSNCRKLSKTEVVVARVVLAAVVTAVGIALENKK